MITSRKLQVGEEALVAGNGGFSLVGSGKKDHRTSFEHYYRESYSLVYNYVLRRTSNREVAEDVVSEAYLRAARFYDRFDPTRAKFSTWVTRIAINCMASHYRRERVHQPLEDIPERLISVEDEPSLIDEQELVERLLGVLNDNERTVVLMKYRDGKRNVSIADELGMNPSTVSTVLSRALAKMRDAYERSM